MRQYSAVDKMINNLSKADYIKRNPEKHRMMVRKAYLRRNYKMTVEDYEKLLNEQNNCCAICKTKNPGGNRHVVNFLVDHNHGTGKTRGLLCHSCNTGLGKFSDKLENLKNAVAYLEKYEYEAKIMSLEPYLNKSKLEPNNTNSKTNNS